MTVTLDDAVFPAQVDPHTRTNTENIIYLVTWAHSMNDWHTEVNGELTRLHAEDLDAQLERRQLRNKVGRDGWVTRIFTLGAALLSAVFTHWLATAQGLSNPWPFAP